MNERSTPSSTGAGSNETPLHARRVPTAILDKLAEDYPELELGRFTKHDLRAFLKRWEDKSSATRANVVSVLHSFFGWATAEDLVEVDPSAPLRRPKKRRADVYRPSIHELAAVRAAALPHERPAIILMEGAGLRLAEVLNVRWADIDLIRGRVRVFRKGANWQPVPLAPDVLDELRYSFRTLQPELDDYVFTVEVEQWVSQYERSASGKTRRCRRARGRYGGWLAAFASAPASASFPRTSCGMASRIAFCVRAAATSPRFVRFSVTPGSTRLSCTPMRSRSTSSRRRLLGR